MSRNDNGPVDQEQSTLLAFWPERNDFRDEDLQIWELILYIASVLARNKLEGGGRGMCLMYRWAEDTWVDAE